MAKPVITSKDWGTKIPTGLCVAALMGILHKSKWEKNQFYVAVFYSLIVMIHRLASMTLQGVAILDRNRTMVGS